MIGAKCRDTCSEEVRFINTPVNGIACLDADGNQITASAGGDIRGTPGGYPHKDEGFNFDDGFGVYETVTLDPDVREGYIGIAKGKEVYVTLNIEMLHDPIPLNRRYAYPMNVQWQWERWLEEIRPDEINFRMFKNTPRFLLNDPQCKHMLEVAKSYNVPMTVERYVNPNMEEEYRMLNETGLFDAFIVYESASLFT